MQIFYKHSFISEYCQLCVKATTLLASIELTLMLLVAFLANTK